MRSYAACEDYDPRPSVGDLGPLFEQSVPYQRFSDTSRDAAAAMESEAGRLRQLVIEAYKAAGPAGLSADQCAEKVGESILAIRPRVSECFMAGQLVKTGRRAQNDSGLSARVLVAREYAGTSEAK